MALDLLSLYFTIVLDILWIVFYKNFGFTVPRLLPELWIYVDRVLPELWIYYASCFTRTLDLRWIWIYCACGLQGQLTHIEVIRFTVVF